MENTPTQKPKFPLRVIWHEDGEVDWYDDELSLLGSLEQFDSDDPEDRVLARVVDALGRSVCLRVDIMQGVCEARLVEPR